MPVVVKMPSKITKPEPIGAAPPQYSDEWLARRFAEEHEDDLRYIAQWDRWFHFDGKRWQADELLINIRFAREVCSSAAAECGNMPIGAKLASSGTIHAVERLARADKKLAASVDQWDADRWLLNTPDNPIDLRTGKTRGRDPLDYCTRMAAVSPGGSCPVWLGFLQKIFEGDLELIEYVQRVAGYVLTGSTEEHVMFFCHGTGANGKSTLLNTLTGIIGDYSRVAPMETFTASSIDRHPTELAVLCGARMVTANETEEGRRLAEARIKSVTGGDPITARHMRQDPFTFPPQFKLVMAGNHKPGLGGVDEATRRRIHFVPFGFTVPEKERDPGLPDKLRNEWPGILAWMIEGCLKWQSHKLNAPLAVKQATESYLEAEDALGQWLEECCEMDHQCWEGSSALFASWKGWADRAGESARSQRRFVQALESKGFHVQRKAKARGFSGLRLKANAKQDVALDLLSGASVTLVTPKTVNSK